MTDVVQLDSGSHTALLDPMRGAGVLVAPRAASNVQMGAGDSLHESSWQSIVGRLVRDGWTLLCDEWEVPETLATLPDGREVCGLYPDLDDEAGDLTAEEEHKYRLAVLGLVATLDAA